MDNSLNVQGATRPEKPIYIDMIPTSGFISDGYSNAQMPQAGIYTMQTPSIAGIFLPATSGIKELTKNITEGKIDWSNGAKIGNEVKNTKLDLIKLCKSIFSKTEKFTLVDEKNEAINFDRLLFLLQGKEPGSKIFHEGSEINNIRDLELLNKIHSDDLDIPVLKSLKDISNQGIVFTDDKSQNKLTLYEIYKRLEKDANNLGVNVKIGDTRNEQVNNTTDLLCLSYIYCKNENKPMIKDLLEDKRFFLKSLVSNREKGVFNFKQGNEEISSFSVYKKLTNLNAEKISLTNNDGTNVEVSSVPSFYTELENLLNPTAELLLDKFGLKDAKLETEDLLKRAAGLMLGILKSQTLNVTSRELTDLFKDCVDLAVCIPEKLLQKTNSKKLEKEIFDYFKTLVVFKNNRRADILASSKVEITGGKSIADITKALKKGISKALYDKSEIGKAFNSADKKVSAVGDNISTHTFNLLNSLYDNVDFGNVFKIAGRAIGAVGGALAGFAAGHCWGLDVPYFDPSSFDGTGGVMTGTLVGMPVGLFVGKQIQKLDLDNRDDLAFGFMLASIVAGPIIGGSVTGGAHFTPNPNTFTQITSTALGGVGGYFTGGLIGEFLGKSIEHGINKLLKKRGLK